jgi:hypothetical protein
VPLNVVPSVHVAMGVPPAAAAGSDVLAAVAFVLGAAGVALAAGVAGAAADVLSSHVSTPL